jgi:hypothetical protein
MTHTAQVGRFGCGTFNPAQDRITLFAVPAIERDGVETIAHPWIALWIGVGQQAEIAGVFERCRSAGDSFGMYSTGAPKPCVSR